MSRVIAPAEADVPAAARPAFDPPLAGSDACRICVARAGGSNTLDAWLDVRKAMNTSLDVPPRQGTAHGGEEVNA